MQASGTFLCKKLTSPNTKWPNLLLTSDTTASRASESTDKKLWNTYARSTEFIECNTAASHYKGLFCFKKRVCGLGFSAYCIHNPHLQKVISVLATGRNTPNPSSAFLVSRASKLLGFTNAVFAKMLQLISWKPQVLCFHWIFMDYKS